MVGLTGFEQHYPKSLSGGMRMRCSLARTLTLRPPVLLFDEPFGAVDEITREHLNDQTLELFLAEQFAALFITHSISEAVFMSSRVLVMSPRPGRIVAEFEVPFPYPRSPDLRFEPAFGALERRGLQGAAGRHRVTDTESRPVTSTVEGDPVAAASSVGFTAPTARRERWAAIVLPPLILGIVLIGAWYFVSYVVLAPRRRFLLRPPHEILQNGFLDWDVVLGDPRRAVVERPGGVHRADHLDRPRRSSIAVADEPDEALRAGAVPLHGDAAGDPDPGHRPVDRVLVRLRADRRGCSSA